MKETGAHIEISHGKDQSLTFLVTGKQNEVLKARAKILSHFQTQVSIYLLTFILAFGINDLSELLNCSRQLANI